MSRFVGHGRHDVTDVSELVAVEDHLEALLGSITRPEPIELRLADALGLVLTDDVTSEVTVPAFANAAMDGYAIIARDVQAATVEEPVRLAVDGEVAAGPGDLPTVRAGRSVRIMTGAPMPPGADTVVPVENTSTLGVDVLVHRAIEEGAHIRSPGEDLQPGQPLLAKGRRLAPADLGVLAAAGVSRVECLAPPRVVVISSGDELVAADKHPEPGQIRDVNGPMLAAMVRAAGAVPFSAGIVRDDRKSLMYALDTSLGHADLIICTGGASAGTRDLLPDVIGALGEVHTAKVAMKPGMPQIRGVVAGCPVIGLPGNPVSAFVSFEVFARPVIRALQGRRDVQRPVVSATAAETLHSPPGKRSYLRVRLARDGAAWSAHPTGAQGSHVVSSLARADGLAVIDEDVREVAAGEQVRVQLLVDS